MWGVLSLYLICSKRNIAYSSPFFRTIALFTTPFPLFFCFVPILGSLLQFLIVDHFKYLDAYFVSHLERYGLLYAYFIVSLYAILANTCVAIAILLKIKSISEPDSKKSSDTQRENTGSQ